MMSRWSVSVALFFTFATILPASPGAMADVRSHCARVGDDDRLRPAPPAFIPAARSLFGFSASAPDALVRKSTVFRCMGGDVWLCNYGANLVCGKANASRTSVGAADFCKQNAGSDVVPMAATGHDTIYEWKCVGADARISRQTQTVDPRGFIAGNWKRLAPMSR